MQPQYTISDIPQQEKKNTATFRKYDLSSGYTLIPNELIADSSVSLGARMLLIYLLHLPEKVTNQNGELVPWIIYNSYIQKKQNIGEKILNRMLTELIEAGYMTRERKRAGRGRFGNYEYVFAPFKIFLPNDVKQPGGSSLLPAVLYNTTPNINTTKKTAAGIATDLAQKLSVEPVSPSSLAAASSVEEEERAHSKKIVAKASPLIAERQNPKLNSSGALASLDIPIQEKEWLLKRYSIPDIELSIAYVTHPTTQIKTTVIQTLKWFLGLNPENRPKIQENNIEINKGAAKNMEARLVSEYYQVVALNNCVIVEPKVGRGEATEISYDNNNFGTILENAIKGKGFSVIGMQCQTSSSASKSLEQR